MADTTKPSTRADVTEPPLEGGEPIPPLAGTGGAGPGGGPIPGDPSSEQVATAQQSHVAGRVGPPTVAQDSDAPWLAPEGVDQIAPGAEMPADTVPMSGPAPQAIVDPATLGAGPYGGDTPADDSPATIRQTKPGTDAVTPEELPPGTPVPSNLSASGGPVQVPPARGAAGDTGAAQTTAAPGSSASPASPAGTSASPDAGTPHTATSAQPGSDEHTPSGSDDSGTSTTPAGTSDPAGSTSESGGSTSGATGSTTPNG